LLGINQFFTEYYFSKHTNITGTAIYKLKQKVFTKAIKIPSWKGLGSET
jgi:hypothetical protein